MQGAYSHGCRGAACLCSRLVVQRHLRGGHRQSAPAAVQGRQITWLRVQVHTSNGPELRSVSAACAVGQAAFASAAEPHAHGAARQELRDVQRPPAHRQRALARCSFLCYADTLVCCTTSHATTAAAKLVHQERRKRILRRQLVGAAAEQRGPRSLAVLAPHPKVRLFSLPHCPALFEPRVAIHDMGGN